jgi:glyoxylase-like metal-dependent hydrolase (beta-lactamase superfamily II)
VKPDTLSETQVRDNVWVWTLGGEEIASSYGANCTAVAGRDAVLLIDALIAPAHARLVEAALREKTALPVMHVVLTHHHTDHALGAGWFAARGSAVIAHPACAAAMAREHAGLIESRRRVPSLAGLFADAEPYRPSLLLEDEELAVDLGGTVARVFHPGPGHTPGDLAVHLERESVTVCGDLVSVGYHVNYEDAVLESLEDGLRALAARNARTYVPGHGPAGGAEILEEQRRYHRIVASATSPNEIRAAFPGHLLTEVL